MSVNLTKLRNILPFNYDTHVSSFTLEFVYTSPELTSYTRSWLQLHFSKTTKNGRKIKPLQPPINPNWIPDAAGKKALRGPPSAHSGLLQAIMFTNITQWTGTYIGQLISFQNSGIKLVGLSMLHKGNNACNFGKQIICNLAHHSSISV